MGEVQTQRTRGGHSERDAYGAECILKGLEQKNLRGEDDNVGGQKREEKNMLLNFKGYASQGYLRNKKKIT